MDCSMASHGLLIKSRLLTITFKILYIPAPYLPFKFICCLLAPSTNSSKLANFPATHVSGPLHLLLFPPAMLLLPYLNTCSGLRLSQLPPVRSHPYCLSQSLVQNQHFKYIFDEWMNEISKRLLWNLCETLIKWMKSWKQQPIQTINGV